MRMIAIGTFLLILSSANATRYNGIVKRRTSDASSSPYYRYIEEAISSAHRQSDTTVDDNDDNNDDDGKLCSYTPDIFNFELTLDSTCADETISENNGVDGSVCFYYYGQDSESLDASDITFGGSRRGLRVGKDTDSSSVAESEIIIKKRSDKINRLLSKVPAAFHYKHAANIQGHRALQNDPTVDVVTSVTFVEFDSRIDKVLNQNSTYFKTELYDGDVITYPSISADIDYTKPLSEQTELLPGGIMLILFGVNKDNVVVRNTVAWAYKLNDCEKAESLGDSIGWVKVDNYTPPNVLPLVVETPQPTPMPTEPPVVEAIETEPPVPVPAPVPPPAPPAAKSSKSTKGGKGSKAEDPAMSMLVAKSAKAFVAGAKSVKATKAVLSIPLGPKSATAKAAKLFKPAKAGKADADTKAQKVATVSSGKSGKSEELFSKSSKSLDGSVEMSRPQEVGDSSPDEEKQATSDDLSMPKEIKEYPWGREGN